MLTINHTVLIFYHAHKTAYHKEDINPWRIFGILQNSPIAFHGYLPIYVEHDMAFLYLKDDCIHEASYCPWCFRRVRTI